MESWAAIIADVDVHSRELVAQALSPLRYRITAVECASGIVEIAARYNTALVIAGTSLPGLDPARLRRELGASADCTYVMFLLERHDPVAIEAAFAAGADDALAKPLIAAELRARLQHAARVLALENFRAQLEGEGALLAEISARANFHSRRFLEIQLGHEIERARRYAHPLALVLAEVRGDRTGNHVMRNLGHLLPERFRTRIDWMARYDDARLAFVLPETGLSGALALTRRLHAELTDHSVLTSVGLPIELAFCFGVGVLDPARLSARVAPDPRMLFDAAEAYLRDAARRGRGETAGGPVPHA